MQDERVDQPQEDVSVETASVEPQEEEAYIPRPKEPWHVEDSEVAACIPEHGLIHDYMQYCPTTCDGPLWFQLGGWLTTLSVIAGRMDYHIGAANGRYEVGGLHLWSANVGYTGTRKSQCIGPAVSILRSTDSSAILATDFSIEALHDALEQQDGIGLMHRDEMSTLFNQAKRSYSTGVLAWMLEAYNGGPTQRLTKAGGPVIIPRVRLSVLGNIPPSTLQQNTSREDWRTGFLPRFCFWGARRTRHMPIAPSDPTAEGAFADHLRKYIAGRSAQVIIPYSLARIIADWHYREVDNKGIHMPDELYSTLLRLRTKGFQIACLYALAKNNRILRDGGGIFVDREDIEYALEVIRLLKRSTVELFSFVGSNEEATQEQLVLMHIATVEKATTTTIATALGTSVKTATGICQLLASQGLVERMTEKTSPGRGRPRIFYAIPS